MKFMKRRKKTKEKKPVSSIMMYIGSATAALIGIGNLVNSVLSFNSSVAAYVAQGYQKSTVLQQLVPGQLLPAIFQSVALYGGIALALLSAATINNKLTKSLGLLSDRLTGNEAQEALEGNMEQIEEMNEIVA